MKQGILTMILFIVEYYANVRRLVFLSLDQHQGKVDM